MQERQCSGEACLAIAARYEQENSFNNPAPIGVTGTVYLSYQSFLPRMNFKGMTTRRILWVTQQAQKLNRTIAAT
jgi:hypothetical protein